jgi:hypothetical protein
MKKTLKLIPALAMLLISAILVSTSTYAWFSMNSTVTATGMKVKAMAEKGLLINEVALATDSGWDDEAVANALPGTALIPTSTKDATKWWHANSKTATDEAGAASNSIDGNIAAGYAQLTGNDYKLATTAAVGDGGGTRQAEYNIFYYDVGGSTADTFEPTKENAYYVMYKYYLKASNETGLTLGQSNGNQNIAIKQINVDLADGDSVDNNARSEDLNKALRVGVKMGSKMYIYAPVYAANDTIATYYVTDTYTAASGNTPASVTNTAVDALKFNQSAYTALGSVAGAQGAGTEVDIYVWFEGEDDNCQSDKITPALDNITIDVVFELVTLNADATFTNNEF